MSIASRVIAAAATMATTRGADGSPPKIPTPSATTAVSSRLSASGGLDCLVVIRNGHTVAAMQHPAALTLHSMAAT